MPAMAIPDPLQPAITVPREVLEFAVIEHLKQFGESGLVARTWRWILYGDGPGPISHMNWSEFDGDGPPPGATLAAESTADPPPLCVRHGLNSIKPDSSAGGVRTPRDEVPLRFHHRDAAHYPVGTESGSVTITIREQRGCRLPATHSTRH